MPQKKYDFRNQFEKSSRRYSNEEERLTQLQTVIDAHHKQAQTDENKLLERLLKNGDKQRAAEISRAKKDISKAEKRLKELDSVFAKLYEDRACDKVTERNYMMLSGKCQDEQLKLESEIFTLKDKLRETVQSKYNAEKWLSLIRKYTNLTMLTAPILNELLLGETVEPTETNEIQALAAKLELLNEQFAKRNETRRKVWRIAFIVLGVLALLSIARGLTEYIYFLNAMDEINSSVSNIGGFDAPTDIYVTNGSKKISGIIITVILAVVSGIGIYKTRRR